MKDKILLSFSLILLLMISLSLVSASDNSLADTNHLGENDDSFLKVNSYSSLKYSLGDNENNDLDNGADLDSLYSNGMDVSDSNAISTKEKSIIADNNDNLGDGDNNNLDSTDNDEGIGEIDFSNRSDNIFFINSENFNEFFDDNNNLKMDYGGCTLVFEGTFTDLGIININYPYTHIAGKDNLFDNVAFKLSASDIELANLNMVLDKEFPDNDYAGILVLSNNVSIYNITMNYTVPNNTNGFSIYGKSNNKDKLENLSLVNNTINFNGNNLNEAYDYGIFIDKIDNALVYGNELNSYLPLRYVNWSANDFGTVSSWSVGAFVAQGCDNLRLSSNNINTHVIEGNESFHSLDSCIFYDCKNLTIDQNEIYLEDTVTKEGTENSLSALNVIRCDGTTIGLNDIDVFTNGGKEGKGSAYPIHINGPSNNTKIAFNNLTTFNHGSNCGICSDNNYPKTYIEVISNFINVTGLAGTNQRAILSGIEVQDFDSLIWNNTIAVTNLGENNDNVYGISYTQNAKGNHTFDIQYNNITTNGKYAISLSGEDSLVVNSIVANNVLNADLTHGDSSVFIDNSKNKTVRNNTDATFKNTFKNSKFPNWLKNFLRHTSVKTNDYNWVTKAINNESDGTGFSNGTGNGSGLVDNGGDGSIGNNSNGTDSLIEGNGTDDNPINGTEGDIVDTNSTNNETGPTNPDNGTDSNPVNNADSNPVNNTDTEPVNNTDSNPVTDPETNDTNSNPVNSSDTKPINNADTEPSNVDTEPSNTDTESISSTDTEPINNDPEPVNNTNPMPDIPISPINNTEASEPTNQTNNAESNVTNQTVIKEEDSDPKESDDNSPEIDDEPDNPGDSSEELIDPDDQSNSENSEDPQNQETGDSNDDISDLTSSTVGDSDSSSPGLSGTSSSKNAYELDRYLEDVITKSVDYFSLAGICIVTLLLILLGYKRQKDIEEED